MRSLVCGTRMWYLGCVGLGTDELRDMWTWNEEWDDIRTWEHRDGRTQKCDKQHPIFALNVSSSFF